MYTRIDELIWKDAKLKKISNESKLLFIYLLSCQHRNVLGLYNLPKYYVQGDLGYSFETVSKGLEELFNNGFITYDDEAETILVNNFLKYNPLENPNQVKGALKVMPTIPKTQLFYKLVDVINSSENTHLHELKAGIECYLKSNGFERVTLTVSKQEEVKEEVKEEVTEKKEELKEFLNSICDLYPNNNGKNRMSEKKIKELMKVGYDNLKIAVDRYLHCVQVERDGGFKRSYKDCSTFFNTGYKDYLDGEYKPVDVVQVKQETKSAGFINGIGNVLTKNGGLDDDKERNSINVNENQRLLSEFPEWNERK